MGYLRWGGQRNAVRTEEAEAKNLPKNAATPQRQVHLIKIADHHFSQKDTIVS